MNMVKEKELYQSPELKITKFLESDVISTSSPSSAEWDDANVDSGGWT